MNIKESDNLLLFGAVISVIVSIFAVGMTINSFENLNAISGYVTGATANVTVESTAVVNFTTSSIDWGSGRVNPASTSASLVTTAGGTVSGGNWTGQKGLILENEGNNNVTLNLSGTKTAADFIGGTNPVYEWNISNNESGSCLNSSGTGPSGVPLDVFGDVNTTVGTGWNCPLFQFIANNDTIRIDFNLTVPEDSSTGTLTDTITATVHT